MIKNFKHKGLKRLYLKGDKSQVRPDQLKRIEDILARLDVAENAEEMNLPGYGLHPLKGEFKGFWSVTVSRNWRIIFRFEAGVAKDLDLIDYH